LYQGRTMTCIVIDASARIPAGKRLHGQGTQ
jgi:hypothetical protein